LAAILPYVADREQSKRLMTGKEKSKAFLRQPLRLRGKIALNL
jgi:hypothetical protein